jgi:hypothetical protein
MPADEIASAILCNGVLTPAETVEFAPAVTVCVVAAGTTPAIIAAQTKHFATFDAAVFPDIYISQSLLKLSIWML